MERLKGFDTPNHWVEVVHKEVDKDLRQEWLPVNRTPTKILAFLQRRNMRRISSSGRR